MITFKETLFIIALFAFIAFAAYLVTEVATVGSWQSFLTLNMPEPSTYDCGGTS